MSAADQKVERAANKLQQLANELAGEGGLKAKLAEPLAADADFVRKLKPSLIKQRVKGDARRAPSGPQLEPPPAPKRAERSGGGVSPFLVVGIALAGGIALAKWLDWRGHAHPRW